MDIVGGFDVHRKQITFDYIEMESGEVHRGKIRPATRESLREWLDEFTERFSGKQIAIAVEATTGWRYVVEEMKRAGIEPLLAEPAETKSLQGRKKKRAKTDRLDAGHLPAGSYGDRQASGVLDTTRSHPGDPDFDEVAP